MVSYRFDLYPRTDPLGTLILSMVPEITDGVVTGGLQKAAYRAEANGTSTGQLAVRSSTVAGQAIDPLGLQYVRVTELPGGIVRGGFFLEKGKFAALTEGEDHLLTFSGAGTLSYLSRASMAPYTYLSNDIDAGLGAFDDAMDPFDDTWRLYAQGFGNTLGAMLWRVVREAMLAPSGAYSHRHIATGDVTVAHDADRPESAIPAVTLTFDYETDSDGNPWTLTSGEFTAQVGDNLLSVVKRLMEAGLYVELDPDTFELRAWEQDVHRAMLDATGGAWATDVVRFQSPTDPDDLSTGNIKDDALRNIEAHIKRSALWAGGNDIYGLATSPSDIPWEGHYRATLGDVEAQESIAEIQLQAIAEAGDTLKLRLWMEDDPANGRYLPWDHVLLDQSVTVHTGTDQWEFNERTFPVAALTVELKQGGNWDCIVELGASYSTSASRQFQVQGVGAHTHPPNPELCRPGADGTPPVFIAGGGAMGDMGGANTMALTVSGSHSDRAIYCFVRNTSGGTITVQWQPDGTNPGSRVAMTLVDSLAVGSDKVWVFRLLNPGATVASSVVRVADSAAQERWCAFFYLSGVDQTDPEDAPVFATGGGSFSSINVPQPSGTLALNGTGWFANNQAGMVAPTPGGDQTQVYADFDTRPAGQPDGEAGAGYGSASPSWAFGGVRDWQAVGVTVNGLSLGTEGDCPHDVGHECEVGYSNRAARCDHVHAHGYLSAGETHYHDTGQIEGIEDIGSGSESSATLTDYLTALQLPLIAHRGDVNPVDGYPENTIEALRQAMDRGAHGVEFDVMRSADGTWHVHHDTTVDRTTDGTGNLSSKTDVQIAALNIDGGYGYDAGRHGTSLNVPTLDDALEVVLPHDPIIELDMKGTTAGSGTSLAEYVVAAGIVGRVLINCYDDAMAAEVKAVNANIETRFVMLTYDIGDADVETRADVDRLLIRIEDIPDASFVNDREPKPVDAWPTIAAYWGVDELANIQLAYDLGVRMLQTHDVRQALAYRQRVLYGLPEELQGHWEVVMTGSGGTLAPVTNEAEDDWVYAFVPD